MQSDPLSANSVCAIVITYYPKGELIENLRLLKSQVNGVVVVDNASGGESKILIDQAQAEIPCKVIRNPQNLGIATALNIGFRIAMEQGFEWLLALDQDSTISDGFVEGLLETAARSKDAGIICPTYIDRKSKTVMRMPKLPAGGLLTTMTSGSMLHRSMFLRAGPFDERLFIDSVDNEYCLRIRSLQLSIAQSDRAVLLHSLGAISFRRFLGRKLVATNHDAARRYYMTRNRLLLIFRYRRDFSWIRFDLREFSRDILAVLLVEENKVGKLRFMLKGMIDCARGRWGMQVPL